MKLKTPLIVAAALAVSVPTVAQATTATGDPAVVDTREDDDDDFPWGLLGLLGLAGLLGRKRDDHHDVRTDRTGRS